MKQFIIRIILVSLIYFYLSNLKIIQNNYILGIILSVIITKLLLTNTIIHKLIGGNEDIILCDYDNTTCCNNNEFCNTICENEDDVCKCKEICCKTCFLTGGENTKDDLFCQKLCINKDIFCQENCLNSINYL
jgi:hypothetical protein